MVKGPGSHVRKQAKGTVGPRAKASRLLIPASTRNQSAPAIKPLKKPWPSSVDDVVHVRMLGGESGASMVRDLRGEYYVLKRGRFADHLREEALTDNAYRALDVVVPDSRVYDDGDGRGPYKMARFLEGRVDLGTAIDQGDVPRVTRMRSRLRSTFAVDALLANWDAVGPHLDNVMEGADGTTYHIDNGGGLRYGGFGGEKGSKFAGEVSEPESMRNPNRSAGRVFAGIPDTEVVRQINDNILPRRAALLSALSEHPTVQATIQERLDYMQRWAANKQGTAPPAT